MTVETSETRIAHYRKQAADARARADQMHNGRDREVMLDVAEAWDRLA